MDSLQLAVQAVVPLPGLSWALWLSAKAAGSRATGRRAQNCSVALGGRCIPTVCPEYSHVSSKTESGLCLLLSGGIITKGQACRYWLRNSGCPGEVKTALSLCRVGATEEAAQWASLISRGPLGQLMQIGNKSSAVRGIKRVVPYFKGEDKLADWDILWVMKAGSEIKKKRELGWKRWWADESAFWQKMELKLVFFFFLFLTIDAEAFSFFLFFPFLLIHLNGSL